MENAPARRRSAASMVDRHRAEEAVALVAGVLAGGLGQLAGHRVGDLGELGVVARRSAATANEFGHDRAAPHVDRPVVVHLADQPPAHLDRAAGPT